MKSSYIKNNLIDSRRLLGYLFDDRKNKKINLSSFDYKLMDLKRFKLCLLSVLFTENYDEIIEGLDEELKYKIINNVKIKRRKSEFHFENGGSFNVGRGLKIIKMPENIEKDDYYMILRMIRNGIAHSHYTYDRGMVKIDAYRGEFVAECDVDWLEMMVLCLFANKHSTIKEGVEDVQIHLMADSTLNLKQSELYVVKLKNDKDSSKRMDQKFLIAEGVFAEVTRQKMINSRNKIDLLVKIYKECGLVVTSIAKIDNFEEGLVGITKEDYNSLSFERKNNLLKSRFQYLFDEEKKNTISFKYVLDFLNILSGSINKQAERLRKSGTEFMRECMKDYVFKVYINLVYNYMLEEFNYNMKDIDVSNLNVITYSDSKALERHIRNACCHNRIKIEGEKVYLYDKTKSGTINFQVECSIKDFLQLTDCLVASLSKGGFLDEVVNDELKKCFIK